MLCLSSTRKDRISKMFLEGFPEALESIIGTVNVTFENKQRTTWDEKSGCENYIVSVNTRNYRVGFFRSLLRTLIFGFSASTSKNVFIFWIRVQSHGTFPTIIFFDMFYFSLNPILLPWFYIGGIKILKVRSGLSHLKVVLEINCTTRFKTVWGSVLTLLPFSWRCSHLLQT